MKRKYDRENSSESDCSSLSSHSQLEYNCENELSKKGKELANTKTNIEDQIIQNTEIPKSHTVKVVLSTENDNENIPKSYCENDLSQQTCNVHKTELNNVDKSNVNKGDMLLEAISSDEDIAMNSEEDALNSDIGESYNEYTDDMIIKDFSPSIFEATPLRSIQDPSLSLFEFIHRKLGDDSKCDEVSELVDCLEYLLSKDIDINEKWIDMADRIVLILPKTLCHVLNIPEYCHKLFSLVNITLDFNCALKEHVSMTTLVIRHLKIGLKMIEALCHYNEDLSEHLIKHHQIHNKLINLFFVEHMSLSLKLNILRTLDSSLNGSEPIRLFLFDEVFDDLNGYSTLLKILSIHQRPRVCFLVTSILRKLHLYELLQKINDHTKILDLESELILQECLTEINTIYIKAPILMGCPKRFLQAHAQFELTPTLTHYDVYSTIYRLFDESSLINCITNLLDQPIIKHPLEQIILKLLQSLLNCDHGLRYLGCRHKEVNKLIKVLAKVNPEFKLVLIYKVKVLALVDYLNYFWECNLLHDFKLHQMDSVDILHDVFLLTQSSIGKSAVVHVLTMGDNLDVILNFFKYMEQSKSKTNDLHIMYAFDLMITIMENAEDVSYLKKYGSLIYELACKHIINDLIAWTLPAMKHTTFFHDDVSELCNIVKNNVDNCLHINKTLITTLRILKYLGISNDESVFDGVDDFVELKYKYITLQMYSYDMLGNLLTIVDKICDNYKQPSVNVWKLTSNKAKNIISIICPSMVLIRCMLTLLIQSRGNMFKDLSPIKILLKLYNLMHHVPECSVIREDAIKVIKDITKTFKAYVEIKIGSSVIGEVLAWTLSCPSLFYPGLVLLCKLLPPPLPIQTLRPLEDSVVTSLKSFRNTWVDHLSKLNIDLIDLITILGTSNLLLQPMLCLCVKISDLSISMCLFVAQSLLDVIINVDNNDSFNRYLDFLLQLCGNKKHIALKTGILQILNEEKTQENYEKLIQKICQNIKVDEHEHSILFIQCLCDNDKTLCNTYSEENLPEPSVLNKKFLNTILKALLSLFETCTQLSTLSLIMKTCIMIIQNDYGFYQFKIVLDSYPKPFYNVFNNILHKWNKSDYHCVSTLKNTIKLIDSCIRHKIHSKRLLYMNTNQIKGYLDWLNVPKDNHPISLLKEITQKDDSICYKHLIDLAEFLNNNQESIVELTEPQLPTVDYLAITFKDRHFYIVENIDKNYINPSNDLSSEALKNLEECSIEQVMAELPDFNIKDKINDLFKIEECIVQTEPIVHQQVEPVVIEKNEKDNNVNTSVISTMPIRHKVFSRLGTIQRSETFRYRLPNTSRPPSLHVDDFVAMETRSISARQPGFKLPIQPIQDLNIRLRERQMAYKHTYDLDKPFMFSPYKSHLSLHSWHAQVNAMAHLHANYHQTISSRQQTIISRHQTISSRHQTISSRHQTITSRHLELQRHSLVAEWNQLRIEAELRKKRTYSRR
ncbi:Hypothetical protein CINCED_3A018405 [Cinara cedri]|uniref:Protein virilizer n=1 Tax=Cinara cedri TaxID=506608 RepID=A0A5E4MNJ6_9HEMI|nr:Hypothetical protein CINCED_3A018405 [Cinara cedri]